MCCEWDTLAKKNQSSTIASTPETVRRLLF
jgi:hypothetical protein